MFGLFGSGRKEKRRRISGYQVNLKQTTIETKMMKELNYVVERNRFRY